MRCTYCEGEMRKGKTPLHIDRHGYHVTIDNAPAWVCEQCGESYFEEREIDIIQKLITSIEKNTQKLSLTA